MATFPSEPVTPRVFMEEFAPAFFAEVELPEDAEKLDLKLGIALRGEDGGEWTLHAVRGELEIVSGLVADCDLTLVQSVADWRSALWEGHPALVAEIVKELREGNLASLEAPSFAGQPMGGIRNPEALRELESLPGLIEAIVAGNGRDIADWRLGLKIGPGPIPESPNATVRIGADEAELLRKGELHPLEALITGQLRLEGDFGLVIQLQAIAMAASMPPPSL